MIAPFHTGLWLAVVATLATGAWRGKAAIERIATASERDHASVLIVEWPSHDSLLAAAAAAGNPFEPPMSVPPNTGAPSLPAISQGPSVAPALTLLGIVGPPWSAVVAGFPNVSGAVVLRVGDTVAGFSIVRVRRDTLVLRNGGSTLALAFVSR